MRAGTIWCKSWNCEYCQPIRLRQLQAQAVNGAPSKFITITSRYRPEEMTPDEAAQQLVHAWRMVVQRAKREGIWTDCQYIAVFELTERGWPHLHILARCDFVQQRWLSDRMADYADSPIVDVRAVKGRKRAAWYVAKYCSKGPDKFQGCKRYWRTHGYDLSPGKTDKPLHDHFMGFLQPEHIAEAAATYERFGYRLAWTSDHSFIAAPQGIDLFEITRTRHRRKRVNAYRERKPCNSDSKTTA